MSERILQKGCCGKSTLLLHIDLTVDATLVDRFEKQGFIPNKTFIKSQIFYVENANIIVSGVFGGTKLKLYCKQPNCEPTIQLVESLLKN